MKDINVSVSSFESIILSKKAFEIVDNIDLELQAGDNVVLNEVQFERTYSVLTGRRQNVKITYVSSCKQPQNQVVVSISLSGDVYHRESIFK